MEDLHDKLKRLARGKKLLLVEDDIPTRDVLRSFLSEYFSLIKVASDGSEAWSMYRQEPFDLVISDIEMAKTNGVMLSKGIKARNPHQAIIISSAYTDEKYLVELINIGVDGFVKKPVNIINIHENIIKVLTFVQLKTETSRIRFKTITQEITKKEIPITKSIYQKSIEESETSQVKISVKEFMERIEKEDPESYQFLTKQKEILFDCLHEMTDNYEMFAYKNYEESEPFEALSNDLFKLYSTLEFFDKVKKTAIEILRLANILKTIDLDSLTDEQKEAFDILEFLIKDIQQYILNMFIDSNVQDINYFHDSLRENITTFENILNKEDDEEDEDDEIEFL